MESFLPLCCFTFVVGVLMNGPLFKPTGAGDVLSRLIQYGGFVGDLAIGSAVPGGKLAGLWSARCGGAESGLWLEVHRRGGFANILAMVDAYEIATRQKD